MTPDSGAPRRTPARLAPIFLPRIWGARDLSCLFPERSREDEPIGEAWLTGNDCRFAAGVFSGCALSEVWTGLPETWTGTRLTGLPRIPLLVKFIFPEDKLSVQVHPDDAYAREHEAAAGGTGKTEMWYVISAREGAELRVGLRQGVTRESFECSIAGGTAEECLERVPVRTGDAIFVPAGTAHTIGPGVVLCEVQQHSDITYRVFDYDRTGPDGKPRSLHLRQALDVMRFGRQYGGRCEPISIVRGAVTETLYAACPHFAVERWEFREALAAETSPEHFEMLIFLSGNGRIECMGCSETYKPAEAWMLPAALGEYHLLPGSPTALLRAYVPNMQDIACRLARARVEEAQWMRVMHP